MSRVQRVSVCSACIHTVPPLVIFCISVVYLFAKSQKRLSDFPFTFHFHALEKEMATHSSVLAWRISGMGAWWAAVYGVTQSRTRLKRLSSSSSIFVEPILIYLKSIIYINVHCLCYLWVSQKYNDMFLPLQ